MNKKRFVIESIGALKNGIDFESEEFVETAVFEQEMVIVDVDVDKKREKKHLLLDVQSLTVTSSMMVHL